MKKSRLCDRSWFIIVDLITHCRCQLAAIDLLNWTPSMDQPICNSQSETLPCFLTHAHYILRALLRTTLYFVPPIPLPCSYDPIMALHLQGTSDPVRINPAMVITGIGQWITRRMRLLFQIPPGLGAFALPAEITLIISSQLDVTSRLSLSLTCRTLYSVCFPERVLQDTAEKEQLLLLLERDLPTHYFCHLCVKLHRWRGSWSRSPYSWQAHRLPCRGEWGYSLHSPASHTICYRYARLIMNRHLYGSLHGLPLQSLESQEKNISFYGGIVKTTSRRVRIVDDQLLLLATISLSHPKGDTAFLRRYLDLKRWEHRVCPHITMGDDCSDYGSVQVPELVKPEATSEHFQPCNQGLGSCPFCLTDYAIDITWQGDRKGYLINVLIYSQLGDCRSPFAWQWLTMSTSYLVRDAQIVRKDRAVDYGPGCVRALWSGAEGIVAESGGDWIEIPRPWAERRSMFST